MLIGTITRSQTIVDSLENELKLAQTDTAKLEILNDLVRKLTGQDFDKAFEYADQSVALAEKTNHPFHTYDSYFVYGRLAAMAAHRLEDGERNAQKALAIATAQNDTLHILYSSMVLAALYDYMDEVDKSLEQNFRILEQGEKLNNQMIVASTLNNIGHVYLYREEKEKAKKYFQKAVEVNEKHDQKNNLVTALMNLGKVTDNREEALDIHKKAWGILNSLKANHQKMGNVAFEIAHNYLDNFSNQQEALSWFRTALPHSTAAKDSVTMTSVIFGIGLCHEQLGDLDSAQYYLEKTFDSYEQLESNYNRQRITKSLASIYAKKKNYEKAYQMMSSSYAWRDSVYTEKNAEALSEHNVKYETAEKEKEIAQQDLLIEQGKNNRNKIILGAGTLLLIASLFFQRFYFQQKRKKQEAEMALLAEQKEADKLRELDRLKSTFFTNISHELRTPLTLVAAPLTDALQEVKPSPLKNTLELANSNTKKLLRLVNEILDLSKLEAGKVETKLSEVNLLTLTRRLFYAFESIAQVRGLELKFTTNVAKDLKVNLDIEKFEKIINNLLANAIKFTEKGGSVALNVHEENGNFEFKVSDTGMGISEEELPKVFDRFYQSTSENTPLQGGTGIGLSLAKELAHLLHGDLKVESQLNEGSQFILNLPLHQVNPSHKVDKKDRLEEITIENPSEVNLPNYVPLLFDNQKPKILIIEDNLEMSEYLEKHLSKEYDCTKAYDGAAALEILDQQSFDLITCDVMMPNMDGFSFREKLVENEVWRQIPFIMLTARAMEEDKLKGLRLGVDDYLTKPFNLNELKARVHNLLSNKLVRDNFEKEIATIEDETPLTHEEKLLQNAEAFILKRLDDPKLRVDDLATELNLSARQLSRTLNKIIGISPVNFILEVRLQKARQLLESKQFMTVSEVRYEIGIESASYFTKKFTERFGKNPKEYLA